MDQLILNQNDYWNSVADTKTFTTPFQHECFQKYAAKDALIVDIGCGYGRTLHELSERGYKNLTGYDFSEKMIERGRQAFPELNLQSMEAGIIPLPENSADAVILFAVLTCIISDDDQKALIREISRILKPGGILYVNDFLLNDDERNISRYEAYQDKYQTYGVFELPEGALLRHHSQKWIQTLLSDFKQQEFQHLTFRTMNGHTSNGFFFIGKK